MPLTSLDVAITSDSEHLLAVDEALQRLAVHDPVGAQLVGLAFSTWSFLRERTERQRAVKAELERGRLLDRAQQARASETEQRGLAEQRLYDSLVGQARATRTARRVGYRDEVFKLLKQAALLDVPQKNLAELRQEAVACLGDFVGLKPALVKGFPAGTIVSLMRVAPSGQVAAFALEDGMLILRGLPGGAEMGRFKDRFPILDLSFSARSDELFFLTSTEVNRAEDLQGSMLHFWSAAPDGSWSEVRCEALPGAFCILSSSNGECCVSGIPGAGGCWPIPRL